MQVRATTILCVRHRGRVALGGDGQVTVGDQIFKSTATKIRRLHRDTVLCGFAGSAADALALVERFEARLADSSGQVLKAAVALAKDWRTDRAMRRLEAMMAIADARHSLILSGNGDIIEPSDGILAIGSGGAMARAAALAMLRHSVDLSAADIVREGLRIAADICVYTNDHISVEELPADE